MNRVVNGDYAAFMLLEREDIEPYLAHVNWDCVMKLWFRPLIKQLNHGVLNPQSNEAAEWAKIRPGVLKHSWLVNLHWSSLPNRAQSYLIC